MSETYNISYSRLELPRRIFYLSVSKKGGERISFVNCLWNCPLDAMHNHLIELQHNIGVYLVTQQVFKGQIM